jgi:hypothetical protein
MSEFKDKIPAAGGTVEFLFDPATGRLATQISGFSPRAMYIVAVSMDGRALLSTVSAGGIGQTMTYPQPSVLTYIQSDEQCMWGRNCPVCEKYFRTNHVMGESCCPYCAAWEDSLAFVSKDQRKYITAYYDAFARAYIGRKSTTLAMADITDQNSAWHYDEEKLQTHFTCDVKDCHAQADILGEYGYCPGCGRTNAHRIFSDRMVKMLKRWEEIDKTVSDKKERGEIWEDLTVKCVSELEALAKHLRRRLLLFPMTARRKKQLEELSFQQPLAADEMLMQWFDVGLLNWPGDTTRSQRAVPDSDIPFIKKMLQKRHVLIHSLGIVDDDYIALSSDTQVRLGERIRVRSNEAKRFIETISMMGNNLLDNLEYRLGGDGK